MLFFGEKRAPFIANLWLRYSNSSVMLHTYVGHTNFNMAVFETMLKAPQVGT